MLLNSWAYLSHNSPIISRSRRVILNDTLNIPGLFMRQHSITVSILHTSDLIMQKIVIFL